jgi:hypothetical protein
MVVRVVGTASDDEDGGNGKGKGRACCVGLGACASEDSDRDRAVSNARRGTTEGPAIDGESTKRDDTGDENTSCLIGTEGDEGTE